MLDFSDTPPPLHYSPSTSEHDRSSTRETTPIGTPVASGLPNSRRPEREKDLYFSWHRKPTEETRPSPFQSSFLEPDLEDSTFPLFPSSPPDYQTMSGPAAPIDIGTPQASISPPGQQASNLTSALQRAGNGDRSAGDSNIHGPSSNVSKANVARKDSFGASMAQFGNGTKPITVNGSNHNKPRRESLAGSLVGGMSWGGVSVGSWIRDDIIMTGTSPFTLQSPSYHSSSYLPKLEANFMRDFACCGVTLPSLHDLLQHYEEAHAQKSSQPQQRTNSQGGPTAMSDNRAQPNTSTLQQQSQQNQQPINTGAGRNFPNQPSSNQQSSNNHHLTQHQPQTHAGGFTSSQSHGLPDIDTVEDMEMDDALGETEVSQLFHQSQANDSGQHRFGQQNQDRVTPLNLGMLQGHQGLRSSQPGTPTSSGRPVSLQNNPTVSSVNTPTLMNHPLQQQQQNMQYRGTPDSSTPGTPADLDDNVVGGFGDMSMQNHPLMQNSSQLPGFGGGNNDMLDLCIDEPAKRLFSPTGGFNNNSQEYAHFRLGGAQYGPNSEIARRIREQQKLAGVPDTTLGMMPNEEPKPFRCPVIGCEKAYKNQNGLKYHKSHGHNNQQLHDNADGTFSIVNPETSAPYPGTLGMEKEKPYRCEVCGKRYKNLNGLKYHKSHSPPCNPELQLGAGRNVNVGGVMQGQNINVAGAGLPGIGEEGLL